MFDGIRFSNERLISASGLSIVGLLLKKTYLAGRLNRSRLKENAAPHIKNADVAFSYIGMLCQGKSDFDFIREMDSDPEFYCRALNVQDIPSSETLRQRLDMAGSKWRRILLEENIRLLSVSNATLTSCFEEHIPLDVDVSPFDNSGTSKQGVAPTYKGFEGYAPIFAYLGTEGYLVNTELRIGSDHCQKNTVSFLRDAIGYARSLTGNPLLIRMDAGNDSTENLQLFYEKETKSDFIIKRNLRKESPEMWLSIAKNQTNVRVTTPREGKTVYIGSVYWSIKDVEQKARIVFRITERTITTKGQLLLVPEIEAETWWTSLLCSEEKIIQLYNAHGTSEQFHSELKTDMDLERLPSGKFATNGLVLELAMLAYNILRRIGQESLKKNDAPLRKPARRRRLRTVIQNLVLLATRVVAHARKVYLNLGRSNSWDRAFYRIYHAFVC